MGNDQRVGGPALRHHLDQLLGGAGEAARRSRAWRRPSSARAGSREAPAAAGSVELAPSAAMTTRPLRSGAELHAVRRSSSGCGCGVGQNWRPRVTAASTSRASKTSRGMQYADSRGSAITSRPSGLRRLQPPDRHEAVRGIGDAERREFVRAPGGRCRRRTSCHGGNRTRRPARRGHAGSGLQRGQGGGAPGRSGADDDEVEPGIGVRRRGVAPPGVCQAPGECDRAAGAPI